MNTESTQFKKGDWVIVTTPEDYIAQVRNRIKGGRPGEVVNVREDGDSVFVRFPAQGRRQEYKHHFRVRALAPVDGPGVAVDPKPGLRSPSKARP